MEARLLEILISRSMLESLMALEGGSRGSNRVDVLTSKGGRWAGKAATVPAEQFHQKVPPTSGEELLPLVNPSRNTLSVDTLRGTSQ